MRWSRLKKLLEEIIDAEIDLDIHCSAYRGEGGLQIGRYWIVLDGETIFDEPKNISRQLKDNRGNTTASTLTVLLREYLDTPKDELLSRLFPADTYGLIDIIRAADRRIGKRRLLELFKTSGSSAVRAVIIARHPDLLRAIRTEDD